MKRDDLTDKGVIKFIDNQWKHKDGSDADLLVVTARGVFRESELVLVERAKKEDIPVKAQVDFNTVMSVDIRPGRVLSATRVPKTDKLIRLTVMTNLGEKSVVTNLGGMFEPADFSGKVFMFVVNMPPVTMKGVISEAMIIASTHQKFDADNNQYVTEAKLLEVDLQVDSTIL